MNERLTNKTEIVLFHPSRVNRLTPIITMGLWGLADYLSRNGFPTKIIHTGLEQELYGDVDLTRYVSRSTLIAGISVHWFPMTAEVLDLAPAIKRIAPDAFVVLGGFTASAFYQQLLDHSSALDGIIRGDAEKPLLALAQVLSSPSSTPTALATIPNLVWRKDEAVIANDISYLATAEIYQHFSLGNYRSYLHNYEQAITSTAFAKSSALVADFETDFPLSPMFYLLTGKGCTVNCTMCGGGLHAQRIMNNRSACLTLSADTIVKTIREGMQSGYNCFYVCFDPTPPQPHYFYWLRRIQAEQLDLNLCFGFWGLPTAEAISELKATSRNLLVDLSPETIDEETRRKNKGFHYSNQELYTAIENLYQNQIYTHIYFSYFLPHQTPAELAATREAYWTLNAQYPHYIEATNIMISTDPCSPLYRNPDKYGVELRINSFEDHLALCRSTQFTNILIHRVKSLPAEIQERYAKLYAYDAAIKRLFRYNTKLLIRAFPSVPRFIEFLDQFYEQTGLMAGETAHERFEKVSDVMRSLHEFTLHSLRNDGEVQPYIFDLMEFILAMIESRDQRRSSAITIQPKESAAPEQLFLMFEPSVKLVELQYDVFRANRYLRTQKAFPIITRAPLSLLIAHKEEQPLVLQLNDSLYFLCKAIAENRNRSVSEIVTGVAAYYSDDEKEQASIAKDLHHAIARLIEQGLVKHATGEVN